MSQLQRIADIASALRHACLPVVDSVDAIDEASATLKGAREGGFNVREGVMIVVAGLACEGDWTERETALAVKEAVAGINDKDSRGAKALATFIGETRRAAHPLVRGIVRDLIALRDLVWDDEDMSLKADKGASVPVHKAFQRKYFALTTGLMFAAGEEKIVITTCEGFTDYARTRDPDLDHEKVYKRLEKLRADLASMASDLGIEDIASAVSVLSDVNNVDVKEAVARKRATMLAGVKVPVAPNVMSEIKPTRARPANTVVVAPTTVVKTHDDFAMAVETLLDGGCIPDADTTYIVGKTTAAPRLAAA